MRLLIKIFLIVLICLTLTIAFFIFNQHYIPGIDAITGGTKMISSYKAHAGQKKVLPSIDSAIPAKIETATFAVGWFWGPDARFGAIDGVIRTRVGYSGGTKKNPTYYSLGDHTETFQIDYDPARITFGQLLDIFWKSHDPSRKAWSRQYMAAVFYHNEEQKQLAIKSREREAERLKIKIYTDVLPAAEFYLAEDYHQKYYLRQVRELAREYTTMYPVLIDFIASTAVSRANGYVGGYGTLQNFQKEANSLGLSSAGSKRLLEMVQALDKSTRSAAKSGAFCPVPFKVVN